MRDPCGWGVTAHLSLTPDPPLHQDPQRTINRQHPGFTWLHLATAFDPVDHSHLLETFSSLTSEAPWSLGSPYFFVSSPRSFFLILLTIPGGLHPKCPSFSTFCLWMMFRPIALPPSLSWEVPSLLHIPGLPSHFQTHTSKASPDISSEMSHRQTPAIPQVQNQARISST